ncbi:MAG: exonuclease subunit SbcD, partial [Bacteroidales bacterium]|nr:exonuclease subunit SbcD [Bacteroidales bacterium]
MFRILHTSDLHIGKRLHQEELKEDHRLFFNWLVDYIKHNDINALVVAGDVFDVANPSSEARRMYYDLLRELMLVKCKLIITGGNHDSPATLEAPRELLKQLDIHVRGSYNADTNDFLIPIQDHKGETILVVAAIPYLRDSDIRKYQSDESYEDRNEALKNGIAEVFREASQACKDLFPGIPAIAMGHLFIQGGSLSESEREIQIGNLAGLETNRLNDYFSYYA